MADTSARPVYVTAEQQDQLNKAFAAQYAMIRRLTGCSALSVETVKTAGDMVLDAYRLGRVHERQVHGQ
jgi:hypothetical protein